MRITSPAFLDGDMIPAEYTIDGGQAFIPLDFHEVPPSAVALALVFDDPDVPREIRPDGLFTHWTIWDMDPAMDGLRSEDAPGIKGATTRGNTAYVAPSPPPGNPAHRYFFKLYALDEPLGLPEGSVREDVLAAIADHAIDDAQLLGLYQRAS